MLGYVKELRKTKGISQATLAERLGLSKSTIGMYETGDITPSVEALEMIADYFNVDMSYLLGKEEQSRFFMDYSIYNTALFLAEDEELLHMVQRMQTDATYKDRLKTIVKLMENDK